MLMIDQYIEWGLDKHNPRALIVVSTLDNKDLAMSKLEELVTNEGNL